MLAKCANPPCFASFRYLHEGRLFVLDVSDDAGTDGRCRNERLEAHGLRYFWLCDTCHRSMTVVVRKGREAEVVRLLLYRVSILPGRLLASSWVPNSVPLSRSDGNPRPRHG